MRLKRKNSVEDVKPKIVHVGIETEVMLLAIYAENAIPKNFLTEEKSLQMGLNTKEVV
jgi:hypothetical protein